MIGVTSTHPGSFIERLSNNFHNNCAGIRKIVWSKMYKKSYAINNEKAFVKLENFG